MTQGTGFVLLDPVGEVQAVVSREVSANLPTADGKAVGLLYNGHYAAIFFWEAFQRGIEERKSFSNVICRVKGKGGSVGVSKEALEEIATRSDMVVVGVGA